MSDTSATTDHPLDGRVRAHMDFNTPHHLASFIRLARERGLFPETADAVAFNPEADSAEAVGAHHQFLVVPAVRPEHGARITDLVPLPAPPAEPEPETSGPPPGPPMKEGGTTAPW
jgi:hypothetical protein